VQPVSVVCLFCEDIRQEHNEMNTLVGILPDNLAFPSLPAMIPKLGVYVRINIDATVDPGAMEILLSVPGKESRISIGTISQSLIEKARKQAQEKGSPIAGIISRAILSPFEVLQAGRIRALAIIRDEQVLCGGLNIEIRSDQSTASTVS
jgi:hypothetical protein